MSDWTSTTPTPTPVVSTVTGTTGVLSGRYSTYAYVQSLVTPQLQFGTDDIRGQVTTAMVFEVMALADSQIDSALSHMYAVPLRQIKSNGSLVYPPQIVMASSVLTSSILIDRFFAETDPSLSERAKDFLNRYDIIMAPLIAGVDILFGQRRRAKSHFVTPTIQEAPIEQLNYPHQR